MRSQIPKDGSHLNLLSPDYLFNTPANTSAGFTALTVAFGVLFVVSALIYWRRGKLAPGNPVLRRYLRRASKAGMGTSAVALFLAAMRYVQFPYLSMPVLLYILLLSMIAIVGYFVYDRSERYPLAVWRLQEAHAERRYRPTPKRRSEPVPVRPKVRGKRRR
jgi:hypothetical protein